MLYTDGVTEAHPRGGSELFGEDRVRHLLSRLSPDASAQRIATAIEAESLSFAGGHVGDDTAILVLRKSP